MLSGPQKSMKEKTKELGNSNVLFDFYGKRPEMSQLVPLSLQHVLAAIVGVITPVSYTHLIGEYEEDIRTAEGQTH